MFLRSDKDHLCYSDIQVNEKHIDRDDAYTAGKDAVIVCMPSVGTDDSDQFKFRQKKRKMDCNVTTEFATVWLFMVKQIQQQSILTDIPIRMQ